MDRHLGNRLLIGHCSIALVIVLSAVTALVALGSTIRRAERTREIEARLALVRELRADARELAQSARRFLLSGNSQDRQRVFAIDAELRRERDALRARSSYPAGWVADLAEYSATLTTAMSRATDDIETVAHFEDELMRVRNALEVTLDGIVAGERAKLGDLQSSTAFVRRAQWALAGASLLGLALVVVMGVYVFRLHARRLYSSSLAPGGSGTPPFTSDSSPDSPDSLADPSVEPTHLR